ncbi:hypothetical protein ACP70R_037340 [Stipagrostis hirtigluma subsp. patula]
MAITALTPDVLGERQSGQDVRTQNERDGVRGRWLTASRPRSTLSGCSTRENLVDSFVVTQTEGGGSPTDEDGVQ